MFGGQPMDSTDTIATFPALEPKEVRKDESRVSAPSAGKRWYAHFITMHTGSKKIWEKDEKRSIAKRYLRSEFFGKNKKILYHQFQHLHSLWISSNNLKLKNGKQGSVS